MAGTRFARKCRVAAEESRRRLEMQEWVRWKPRLAALREKNESAPPREDAGLHGRGIGITVRTRINTMRSHARAMETMSRWLPRAHGAPRPATIAHFIDCAHATAADPRGPRAPHKILRALVRTERAVGIGTSDRLSAQLEVRAVLRCDDHSRLPPQNLAFVDEGLTATLGRTKTSGAGRKMPELPLVVSRECYMLAPDWIQVGVDVWQGIADFERGYFLLRCDDAGLALVRKPARHAEASAATQEELRRMLKPAACTGKVFELLSEE
ncbi:unnamed protein product, partial [Prorocentrum cordatum]